MPDLLEWSPVRVLASAGAINLVIDRNADTNVSARCWWFSDDETVATRAADIRAGEPFILQMGEVRRATVRRLGFQFHAASGAPGNPHLFVRVVLGQQGSPAPALNKVYEIDLPAGHNFWELTDGMRLDVAADVRI